MNPYNVQDAIIIGLNRALTPQIVSADQEAPKDSYPFGSVKVITAYTNEIGEDVIVVTEADVDNATVSKLEMPEMTLSVNAYSLNDAETYGLIQDMKDWFEFNSEFYLDNLGIAVIDTTDIQNRDVLIQDNYERRFGFDARVRYNRTISKTIESINTVEIQQIII